MGESSKAARHPGSSGRGRTEKAEDGSGTTAFIAVGSNIEPLANITAAMEALARRVRLEATSTFYLSKPLMRPQQPMFVNGVWRIQTRVAPIDLKFEVLRKIETDLGRVRSEDSHAPRMIDLDLILYGDTVIEENGLRIPDPDIEERPFIAAPLAELAPDLLIPGTANKVGELSAARNVEGLDALVEFTAQLRRRIGK
jgi:2-amino-4-hydroxy-6-hydroxymethyldihydropteridine diphosphokinase